VLEQIVNINNVVLKIVWDDREDLRKKLEKMDGKEEE
jgi:hypothetical protein